MKNFDMKIFIIYLLSVNFIIIPDSFNVYSLTIGLRQENTNLSTNDENIQNEILSKIANEPNIDKLDIKSIDENNLNDLINKKSAEIEDKEHDIVKDNQNNNGGFASGLLKSLSNLGGDKINLKLEDLKNDDSEFSNQSCDQIKKLGKQRDYCENKFLLHKGEEKTVECLRSFCNVCCDDEASCVETCSSTHAENSTNNPEEIFMDVCSFSSMGNSFKGFCETMLTEKNDSEYNECFKNFCFDCCSNELKITDFNNPQIMKCMKICEPPKQDSKSNDDAKNINSIEEENKTSSIKSDKNELSELIDIKAKEDINEKSASETEKNTNENEKVSEDENIKVLVDFSKKKKNTNNEINKNSNKILKDDGNQSPQEFLKNELESDKESLLKNLKGDEDDSKKKEKETKNQKNNIEEKTSIDDKKEFVNKLANSHSKEIESTEEKKIKKLNPKDLKKEIQNSEEIRKTCDGLLLSSLYLNTLGTNVHKFCEVDFKSLNFKNKKECTDNICYPCCKSMTGEEKEIKNCIKQCQNYNEDIDILSVKPYIRSDLNIKDADTKSKKISKLKKNKFDIPEIKKIDKTFIEFMNKEKNKDLSNDNFYDNSKENLKKLKHEDPTNSHINFIAHKTNIGKNGKINENFELINIICKLDYFKDCNELLCSDICFSSGMETVENCHSTCQKAISEKSNEKSMESIEFIIKKYLIYRSKNDIIFDNNPQLNENQNLEIDGLKKSTLKKNLNVNKIDEVKKRIDNLRKRLLDEETNLLNLYKLKA